jgi:hypothetical protein
MSKALRASLLVLLMACSAQAGYMPNGSPEPPDTPPAASVAQEQTTDGDISTTSAGSLTQIVLDLLATLPSLF